MYRFAILALVACVSGEVFIASRCPNPTAVQNFDMASFGQGTWFEVARYQNAAERRGNCGLAEYTFFGDSFKIRNYHVADGRLAWVDGTGALAQDAGSCGIMDYTLPYGPYGSLVPNRLYVLATNYRDFAIIYNCRFDETRQIRQDLAWVLSRSKVLNPEIKAYVDNFLRESNVLDYSKFVWPDFSDAACHYQA